MLQTLHQHMHDGKPIYGMHRGTVGFLMNEYSTPDLHERLTEARESVIHPLLMRATDITTGSMCITPSTRLRCSGRPIRQRAYES